MILSSADGCVRPAHNLLKNNLIELGLADALETRERSSEIYETAMEVRIFDYACGRRRVVRASREGR
jgi:hypothetical protein